MWNPGTKQSHVGLKSRTRLSNSIDVSESISSPSYKEPTCLPKISDKICFVAHAVASSFSFLSILLFYGQHKVIFVHLGNI